MAKQYAGKTALSFVTTFLIGIYVRIKDGAKALKTFE